MFKKNVLAFSSFFVLPTFLYATECLDPFEGKKQEFLLQSPTECSVERENYPPHYQSETITFQKKYETPLIIKNTSDILYSPIGFSDYYLRQDCNESDKQINLLLNNDLFYPTRVFKSVNEFDQDNAFTIVKSCSNETLAFLDFSMEKKDGINYALRIYRDKSREELIAFATQEEYSNDKMIIHSLDGSIAMRAIKSYFYGLNSCYSNWNLRSNSLDPTVASYVLAWTENELLQCKTPSKNSHWKPINIEVLTIATVGVIGGLICIIKAAISQKNYQSL